MANIFPYKYQIKISKKVKSYRLRINYKGLIVVTPQAITSEMAESIIMQHQDWVAKHYKDPLDFSHTFHDREQINIFGDSETIRFIISADLSPKVKEHDQLEVYATSEQEADLILRKWLRQIAAKGIIARVHELAQFYGFKFTDISIRQQSSRWGSCSSTQNLNFNWKLIFAPLDILDYVIIHELAHTREMNHSPQFWAIVEQAYPKWREAKKWLKVEGDRLLNY